MLSRLSRSFLGVTVVLSAYGALAQSPLQPRQVQPSNLIVRVEPAGAMPGFLGLAPNLGSPVSIGGALYLIDQHGAIHRQGGGRGVQSIFGPGDAPDGMVFDNSQSILNLSPGRSTDSVYVMFTSTREPIGIPIHRLPAPLPGGCCDAGNPTPVADLYRIGRTEYQVLYEYRLAADRLQDPRAIAALETQGGATHNGGGMLTLPDGRVLFATGDGLPFGTDGRAAPQDDAEHVSKLLIIDPDSGAIEVAAKGLRNVQHMELAFTAEHGTLVGFADIGGVTAEEVNFVPLADLLDTSEVENFGWGRNPDGFAREGTFYVGPGMPLVGGTQPPVVGAAPIPEGGFRQPQAQYGRHDPLGGVAVSGPVTSTASLTTIRAAFTDLSSGLLYATTSDLRDTDAPVLRVKLIDQTGATLNSFQDLVGGRADPRMFRFPDGSAGVLLETTGELYRLTEVDPSRTRPFAGTSSPAFPVRLAAQITTYGCSVNPPGSLAVLAGRPALGDALVFGIDNPLGTQTPGSIAVLRLSLLPDPGFPCGTVLPALGMAGPSFDGELLVDLAAAAPPLEAATWVGPGVPVPATLRIPDNPALVGLALYVQGALVDPSPGAVPVIGLTNAMQFVIGL